MTISVASLAAAVRVVSAHRGVAVVKKFIEAAEVMLHEAVHSIPDMPVHMQSRST